MSRAQAGLEYLMTYGWALVLIATVVGVLVFIVSAPSSNPTFSSSDPTKILLKGGSIDGGEAEVLLQNLTGGHITIVSVALGGSFGFSPVYFNGVLVTEINSGSERLVVPAGGELHFTGISYSGSGTGSIDIEYVDFAGLSRQVSVTGSTGAGSVGGEGPADLGSESNPGASCNDILSQQPGSESSSYWIDPSGSDGFQVYCDMVSDGGGWTRIDFASDLPYEWQFPGEGGSDAWRWLPTNFETVLSTARIQAIQSVSTEGKQRYVGSCRGVLHWYFNSNGNYDYAFGFRFLNGNETPFGTDALGISFSLVQDDCAVNGGDPLYTIWDFDDVRVPIVNVYSRDNGASSEWFGSPLTSNPAWLR